jgi:hypothetical protein
MFLLLLPSFTFQLLELILPCKKSRVLVSVHGLVIDRLKMSNLKQVPIYGTYTLPKNVIAVYCVQIVEYFGKRMDSKTHSPNFHSLCLSS